ncbi:MAG: ASKHA domain-containing protein [Spirochaetota bacterium]
MKYCTVTDNTSGKKISVPEGTLLSDAALELGIPLPTPCGGKGICGKCTIRAQGALSPPTENEIAAGITAESIRLACQVSVIGDVILHPSQSAIVRAPLPGQLDPDAAYGMAIDIGTTTMEFSMVNLTTGHAHRGIQMLNPLRRWGDDVISRIAAAAAPSEFDRQVTLLRNTIMGELHQVCTEWGIPASSIHRVLCAGNTTMQYYLAGLDVSPLGRHPYTADVLDFPRIDIHGEWAQQFPNARMQALPAAGAFLGGDFMAGLSLTLEDNPDDSVFFIDIGTNGEMFLLTPEGRIYATTCAMGPALEGMSMASGMTATGGAITHVYSEGDTFSFHVLNNETPRGIAGTGYIDLTALLLDGGILKTDGAFGDVEYLHLPPPLRIDQWHNMKTIFLQNDVPFTQKDVRNLQLARSASYTAARLLLKEAGCGEGNVSRVILAGAFGENLIIPNFQKLFFLPPFDNAQWSFAGNTSLAGAQKACTDPSFMEKTAALREKINVVELTTHPDFNELFMDSLDFKE